MTTLTVVNNQAVRIKTTVDRGPQGPQGDPGPSQIDGYAVIYQSAQILTEVATQGSWTKVLNETVAGATNVNFIMPQDGRLVFGGSGAAVVRLESSISCRSAADNQTFELAIAVDGTVAPMSVTPVQFANGVIAQNVSILYDVSALPGETFEVWVRNTSSASDFTAISYSLRATALII